MMIEQAGVELIVSDFESGHSPQLSHPDEFAKLVVDLVQTFEKL